MVKTKFNTCQARTRVGGHCMCKSVRWGGRCRLHGGASTGPKTPEGREQSRANLRNALEAINADTPEARAVRHRRALKAARTRAQTRHMPAWFRALMARRG